MITFDIKPCCCCRSCFFFFFPRVASFFLTIDRPVISGCVIKYKYYLVSLGGTVSASLLRLWLSSATTNHSGKHANASNHCLSIDQSTCCSMGVRNRQLAVRITADSSINPLQIFQIFLCIFVFGKMSHLVHIYWHQSQTGRRSLMCVRGLDKIA